MINIKQLVNDEQCYQFIRPDCVSCTHCQSQQVEGNGNHQKQIA
ncbi:hypothetical protein [Spartinivicinus marinus]|nr:hypothetical protein [Spartinivicinus marinus]MCX4029760.1 hypothetical protein [Spartinivicinus marinus]